MGEAGSTTLTIKMWFSGQPVNTTGEKRNVNENPAGILCRVLINVSVEFLLQKRGLQSIPRLHVLQFSGQERAHIGRLFAILGLTHLRRDPTLPIFLSKFIKFVQTLNSEIPGSTNPEVIHLQFLPVHPPPSSKFPIPQFPKSSKVPP